MTFESNRLKHSSGAGVRCGFRGRAQRGNGRITKATVLAYSCHQAHSNLAIEKTSPRCATQDAHAAPWGGWQQEEKMSVFESIVSAIFGSKHAAGGAWAGRWALAPPSSPPPRAGT